MDPKAVKQFEYVLGFYSLDMKVPLLELAAKQLRVATTTKCTALLLLSLLGSGDKGKLRKTCLKLNRMAEERKAPIRQAVADRAALAIRMEL